MKCPEVMLNTEASRRNGTINIVGHGNVVGDGSTSNVNITAPSEVHVSAPSAAELLAALDEFILALDQHKSAISDSRHVREGTAAARQEMAQSAPRWDLVRSILTGVAKSVSGVATLTTMITNILAIMPHL